MIHPPKATRDEATAIMDAARFYIESLRHPAMQAALVDTLHELHEVAEQTYGFVEALKDRANGNPMFGVWELLNLSGQSPARAEGYRSGAKFASEIIESISPSLSRKMPGGNKFDSMRLIRNAVR